MSTEESETRKVHILIACTGSVATIKLNELITQCKGLGINAAIRVVATESAIHFVDLEEIKASGVELFRDSDEWKAWQKRGDPVLHIELRKWADLMLIAPLDANTLAKIAQGLCDNLLTCIVRAWDLSKPLLFAPAMNTYMWEHPLTAQHIHIIKGFGYTEIPCIEKVLMCKDKGFGAMAEVPTIIEAVKANLPSGKE